MKRSFAGWGLWAAAAVAIACLATPAQGAPLSRCTTHRGTIVAVDFGHWGGPIVRSCGIGQPSGYALLHSAGFSTAGDQHDGPAFICRLGQQAFHGGTQYPTPAADPCVLTPPASAYWSYWLARPGHDTWTYSSLGALSDVPKPGEVELWTFGATSVGRTKGSGIPHFAPATLRAHAASATPSAHKTASTAGAAQPASNAGGSPTTATTPAQPIDGGHRAKLHRQRARPAHANPKHHRRAKQHPPERSLPSAGTDAAHRKSGDSPAVVAAEPTAQRSSSGSPVPLVVAICLAAALFAGAGWTARRRRRYE